MNWHRVYDFAADGERIEAIQQATLRTDDHCVVPEPALVGTPEWWTAIESGALPRQQVNGRVGKVLWASMGDWPEFELVTPDGEPTRWTREGDVARFVSGLGVRVSFVYVRHEKSWLPDEDRSLTLTIDIEESRLRSCDVAPGPGGIGFRGTTTLFRPVGEAELVLVEKSGHRRFPPRLPHQPIFYPVETEEYATRIAREWNTKDESSGFAGYVTSFHVRDDFLAGYDLHEAGGRELREYWIPSGDLESLNDNLVGRIDVLSEYH